MEGTMEGKVGRAGTPRDNLFSISFRFSPLSYMYTYIARVVTQGSCSILYMMSN